MTLLAKLSSISQSFSYNTPNINLLSDDPNARLLYRHSQNQQTKNIIFNMRLSSDSLQINTSAEFILELSKDKITHNPHSATRNSHNSQNYNTFDDLEYSVDETPYANVLGQLKTQKHTHLQLIPNINSPSVQEVNQETKKRERKAIFQKYKPKNETQKKDVMQLFDHVLRANNSSVGGGITIMDTTNDQLANTIHSQYVDNFPPIYTNQNIKKTNLNSPPYLPTIQTAYHFPQGLQRRTSNQSVGQSFSINDDLSMIIDSKNNPFGRSRESQQIAELLQIGISEVLENNNRTSFNSPDKLSIQNNTNQIGASLIQIASNPNPNPLTSNIMIGVDLVESQQIIRLQNPKDNQLKNVPLINNQQQVRNSMPQNQSQVSKVRNNTIANIEKQILNPSLMSQIHQQQSQIKHSVINNLQINSLTNSQLSINSNLDRRSNINSQNSHLLSSGSITRAIGDLCQHVFNEPTCQDRIPEFLKECARLNSISINIVSPTLPLNALRHKEILRNLIFEELMAAQTLSRFRDQIELREISQKKIYSSFKADSFMKGQWYELQKLKNKAIIQPKQPYTKGPVDFVMIKESLGNSIKVLKYFQNFIEHFKIQFTQDFRKKYIELRHNLFQIFNNLKKISEDLYMKSIATHLPEHYFRFYQYLKDPKLVNKGASFLQLNKRIDEKQKILLQLQYYKKEKDPLGSSSVSKDIQNKARNQLNILKSAYNGVKKVQTKGT